MALTQARLHERLVYNQGDGTFIWLTLSGNNRNEKVWNSRFSGTRAGALDGKGYIRIYVDSARYAAHRMAWLYMNGEWPLLPIDHINGIKTDNRWINLRLASISENGANQAVSVSNSSGYKGVTWHPKGAKWQAQIKVKRKYLYLGLFDNPVDAHAAYETAAVRHFGEFARVR